MNNYLNNKIKGISKKIKEGHNTRNGSPRNHIYKVNIKGYDYWKIHIKRQEKSKIKYFKKRKDAKIFMTSIIKLKNFNVKIKCL